VPVASDEEHIYALIGRLQSRRHRRAGGRETRGEDRVQTSLIESMYVIGVPFHAAASGAAAHSFMHGLGPP